MAVTVYTSQLSYRGDDALDITRKSAGPRGIAFAPSWPLFKQYLARKHSHRADRASWLEYREKYIAEMRVSYVENRASWKALLSLDTVTLCCYCQNPSACHRVVLASEILTKLGAKYEGER